MATSRTSHGALIEPQRKQFSKGQMGNKPLERLENGRPRFRGCSGIHDYELSGKLGEGTFGEVYKARARRTGAMVAMKKILMHNEKDGFPITALREIKLLKLLSHVNVLKLEEMVVERKTEGKRKAIMYMVTPYMEHDLSGLLENPSVRFTEPQIKCYMLQLLEGMRYLHENKILHRDMKAANLLINNKGILQIADFGLARHYDDPPPQRGKGGGEARREYTTVVVTRWYRPPELLLQLRRYTTAIDMWGVGCVFGEMFKGKPILAGNSDLNQAQIIFDLVGSPTETNMPGWSQLPGCEGVKSFAPRQGNLAQVFKEQGPAAISLLSELLKLDWRKRINAIDALEHPYFRTDPLPARPGDLPQFEDSHELDRRKFRGQKAPLPPAPAGGTVGLGGRGDWSGGRGTTNGSRPHIHSTNSRRPGHMPAQGGYESRIPGGHHLGQRGMQPAASTHRPPWSRDGTYTRGGPETVGDDRERTNSRTYRPPGANPRSTDTYIPSYSGDGSRGRVDRPDRDFHHSDRRERPPADGGRGRSRSPMADRVTERDRERDRERNIYRR